MIKCVEASVLEVTNSGVKDLVKCRVAEWGTVEVAVPTGANMKVGEVRKLTIAMTLGGIVYTGEIQGQYR